MIPAKITIPFKQFKKMYLTLMRPRKRNNSPFMTKQLRKLIMNKSRCKNAYFKNKTVEHWEKYRKLRNECVKITKKAKSDYFANLNTKSFNDSKKFWKTGFRQRYQKSINNFSRE